MNKQTLSDQDFVLFLILFFMAAYGLILLMETIINEIL